MLPEIAQLEFNTAAVTTATSTENLGKSFQYDFLQGDFVLKDGKLVSVEGVEAIKVWVEKVIRTERFKFKIYEQDDGDEYGTTIKDLLGMVLPRSFIEAELKREITEAVIMHPWIQSISNLTTERDGSWVKVSFQINLADGSTTEQEVTF